MIRLDGIRAWAAPIIAVSIVGMALSISHPLFALLLERLGVSGFVIGLNAMAAATAMIPAAILMPILLRRIGLMPLVILATGVLVVAMLAVPLWQNLWWWGALRMVIGFAATAIFFASEFWIVAVAPEHVRGRIIGVYAFALAGSFILGPLLLRAVGVDTVLPFLVAAAIIAAAVPALLWGAAEAPPADKEAAPHLGSTLRFFVTDPGVVWGVVLFGALEFGAFTLLAVWGVRTGFGEGSAINLMISLAAGAMLLQVPIGWAADKTGRRWLLALAALVSFLAPVGMVLVAPDRVALIVLAFMWGGMAVAFYMLALAELGARYSGGKLAEGNAAVVLAYGVGALFAPGAFGLAMDIVQPDGLMWLSAAAALAYLILIMIRLLFVPRKPIDSGTHVRS